MGAVIEVLLGINVDNTVVLVNRAKAHLPVLLAQAEWLGQSLLCVLPRGGGSTSYSAPAFNGLDCILKLELVWFLPGLSPLLVITSSPIRSP